MTAGPVMLAMGDTFARTVDQQFLDLICSDAELLAAEFDAIVTAELPDPPFGTPSRGVAGRHRGAPVRRPVDPARSQVCRARHLGIGGSARQRAPPLRIADT